MRCFSRIVFLGGTTALILAGCAHRQPRIEDLPLPAAGQLLRKLEQNHSALIDLKAEGLLKLRGRGQSNSFGIRIQYLRPDYLSLTLIGQLGIDLGTLLLSQGKYQFSYPLAGIASTGEIADLSFANLSGLDLNSEQITDLFLPLPRIQQIPDSILIHQDIERQLYYFSWSDSSMNYHYWIHPFQPVVAAEVRISAVDDTILYRSTDRVREYSGVFLPQSWNLQIGCGENAYLTEIKLTNIHLQNELSPADFEIDEVDAGDSTEAPYAR
ncbi:MAG: hypothetical protein ABH878_02940 [bacterium]